MDRVKRFGYVLFGAGTALLGEKLINCGASLTYPPYLDHGLYGLIMIAISFIVLAGREDDEDARARPSQYKRPHQSTNPAGSDAQ